MFQKATKIIRPGISLLLVLCYLSILATLASSIGQNLAQSLKAVRLTPAFMGGGVDPAILNYRTNIDSSVEICKVEPISGSESIDPTRAFAPFPTELGVQFPQYMGHATIAIRAPPYLTTKK
jgi:hypothetical protein